MQPTTSAYLMEFVLGRESTDYLDGRSNSTSIILAPGSSEPSRRTKRTMKIGRKVPPHGGNGKLPGGIPIMRPHHKDGLNTDRTGKPVIISESSIYLWHESHKEFGAQLQ